MRRLAVVVLMLSHLFAIGQNKEKTNRRKLGLKVGYNWSYATASSSNVSLKNTTGYLAGLFFAPPSKGLGFRSEVVYSHQGYSFDNGGMSTTVMNDYVYLPQLTTFTIARVLQLQFGAQVGILLNGEQITRGKDSSVTAMLNRLDYGFAGGVELNPAAGLIIGARYNLGLGKLYKRYDPPTVSANPNPYPLPFNPQTTNLRNGVIQLFIGYKF